MQTQSRLLGSNQMSSQITNSPKVFISYSWDSAEHRDRVLALSDHLRADGIDCILDQYEVSPPEGWPRWMARQIREADFVLMICTETYKRRVEGEEIPEKGHGVRWEGHLTYQDLYNAGTLNTRFIPVLLESGKFEHIPDPLQGTTYYLAHTKEGYKALSHHITNQPNTPKPQLGKLRRLAPRERKQDFSEEALESEPDLKKKSIDNRLNLDDNLPQQTDSKLDFFADDNTRSSRGPRSEFQYQIALSFAGEDRKFAEKLAELLKKKYKRFL